MEDEIHFITACIELYLFQCNLASLRVDSEFKFITLKVSIHYVANSNVCIIAKGVYKMYQLRMSLLYKY